MANVPYLVLKGPLESFPAESCLCTFVVRLIQIPAKPIGERKALRLVDHDVGGAISYSRSGQIAGKVAEWRDTKTVGLTLHLAFHELEFGR